MSELPEKPRRVTLVLGGARSGKSWFSEELATKRAGNSVLYVATLEPFDDEMRERVKTHQASRPNSWRTLEAPYKLTKGIKEKPGAEQIVLIDCLTLWSTNRLLQISPYEGYPGGITEDEPEQTTLTNEPDYAALEQNLTAELIELINWLREQGRGLILVSNEVGMGLVPPYPLGRVYRDMLGRLNQRVAQLADEVIFCAAGIAVELKQLRFTDY